MRMYIDSSCPNLFVFAHSRRWSGPENTIFPGERATRFLITSVYPGKSHPAVIEPQEIASHPSSLRALCRVMLLAFFYSRVHVV